jgi:hypothetical protein
MKTKNKLWILRPIEGLVKGDNPWEPWFDKAFGFVVCADSEDAARKFADSDAGDENRGEFLGGKTSDTKTPWMDARYSTCIELKPTQKPFIVMKDFYAA